jgi:dipeptidyl aminopeptidase/acylaminoacyl peptidase
MQYLVNLRPHATLMVESTDNDFNLWLVSYNADDHPYEFFLYNRSSRHAEYLFSTRPELANKKLNKMIGFEYLARDGLKLQAYLSLPPQVALL